MKHPREEEVMSLALSLSTDSSTLSTGSSSAGGGGDSPANNNKRARIVRRRRGGKVVATSGEGDFVCKTCGRAFPTFQALGGHRTSHLRGRRAHGLELGVVGAKALKQHKMMHQQQADVDGQSAANNKQKQPKHECHICGLGFEMGQALGGHMRRHREEVPAGGADDWVWQTQLEMPVHAEPPVLLELFA